MPKSEDKELIKNVRANRDEMGRLLLSSVCQRLIENGFNVSGTLVSYYSPIEEMYIFVGKDPISKEKDGISINNLSKNRLHLKFRPSQDGNSESSNPVIHDQAPPLLPINIQGRLFFINALNLFYLISVI